jgi:hypothetical protein
LHLRSPLSVVQLRRSGLGSRAESGRRQARKGGWDKARASGAGWRTLARRGGGQSDAAGVLERSVLILLFGFFEAAARGGVSRAEEGALVKRVSISILGSLPSTLFRSSFHSFPSSAYPFFPTSSIWLTIAFIEMYKCHGALPLLLYGRRRRERVASRQHTAPTGSSEEAQGRGPRPSSLPTRWGGVRIRARVLRSHSDTVKQDREGEGKRALRESGSGNGEEQAVVDWAR